MQLLRPLFPFSVGYSGCSSLSFLGLELHAIIRDFVSFFCWLLGLFFFVVSYVGRLFVKANGKPGEMLTKLNEMSGFGPEEEIELFEVSYIILVS